MYYSVQIIRSCHSAIQQLLQLNYSNASHNSIQSEYIAQKHTITGEVKPQLKGLHQQHTGTCKNEFISQKLGWN